MTSRTHVTSYVTATIEDTTITQIWGDRRQFEKRVGEYGEMTGARVGFVFYVEFAIPGKMGYES